VSIGVRVPPDVALQFVPPPLPVVHRRVLVLRAGAPEAVLHKHRGSPLHERDACLPPAHAGNRQVHAVAEAHLCSARPRTTSGTGSAPTASAPEPAAGPWRPSPQWGTPSSYGGRLVRCGIRHRSKGASCSLPPRIRQEPARLTHPRWLNLDQMRRPHPATYATASWLWMLSRLRTLTE
jgi:hypothetical protein